MDKHNHMDRHTQTHTCNCQAHADSMLIHLHIIPFFVAHLQASTEPLTTVTTENSTTEKPTMTKPSCVNNSRPAPQDNLTSNPGSDDSQVCTDFKENDGAKTGVCVCVHACHAFISCTCVCMCVSMSMSICTVTTAQG